MIKKALLLLAFLLAGVFVYIFYIDTEGSRVGDKAPNFQATNLAGHTFSLYDLRGEYVLLSFWGSWCGPCLKENPKLRELYREFGNQTINGADGFEIVSIALEKSDRATMRLIEREELNWPYHVIDVTQFVMMSSYAQLFNVTELPSKFLISPDGTILGKNLSIDEIRDILVEIK